MTLVMPACCYGNRCWAESHQHLDHEGFVQKQKPDLSDPRKNVGSRETLGGDLGVLFLGQCLQRPFSLLMFELSEI